jgi:hypothetical protein
VSEADHWATYAAAGFTCWPDEGAPISVEPTADGSVAGEFPLEGAACFVTAHNPGGPAIEPAENDRRHAAFLRDVADHGWSWWPAVGGDPVGFHAEEGVLLLDATVDDALALGARFEQDAIYVWRADGMDLIACDRSRHYVLGWTAAVGTTQLRRP